MDAPLQMLASKGCTRCWKIARILMFVGSSSAFSVWTRRVRHSLQLRGKAPFNINTDEECLIPEANPNSDPTATSLSGVRYLDVSSGIDALYPPAELSRRNARSRTDGYWKYVELGEAPPQEFTYGEFDIDFFGLLLDRAWGYYLDGIEEDAAYDNAPAWTNKTFCDIGSGAGRLVLTAAALHPGWKVCRGIEILEGLHDVAVSIAEGCRVDTDERLQMGISEEGCSRHILRVPRNESCANEQSDEYLPLASIQFACGSFADPYEYLGDVNCAFVFSSCMRPDLIRQLSVAVGRQCKPGAIVITTEYPLHLRGIIEPLEGDASMPHGSYEIELVEKIDGWCWLMGGVSTAYVHRVKTSLWEEYAGPRERSQLPLEEEAFRLVQRMESGELTDSEAFVRRVRNQMVFHNVSPELLPKIDVDEHEE
ncbi:hypothetical protein ACHAXT_008226 [Thalassiosira profunda]